MSTLSLSPVLGVVGSGIGPLPKIDYTGLLPELVLIGGALVLLLVSALSTKRLQPSVYTVLTLLTAGAALGCSIELWNKVAEHGPFTTIASALDIDGFSVAFAILASSILVVAALVADGYLQSEGLAGPEYYALALLAAAGAMFMAAANDLIVVFLGLEIMSIPLYILAGLDLRRRKSGEAAMKYFVLGAFSSAIFVYGIALVYGATGSTNLAEIATYLDNNVLSSSGLLLAGLALLLVGFAFKIAAVPFHMWTPDVYEGAPTPATGFMAAIAKVGGFAALLRVFFSSFHSLSPDWQPLLWALAVVTLLFGAIVGLTQRNIKRMLAYSSINQAGFILVGLQAASASGIAASLYYVFIYSFLVIGSFTVVALVAGKGDRRHDLEAYRGLARRQPVLALAFAILLLAQAGAPFTTGFLAKFYVVEAAAESHSYALAVIAMLSGAIAAAYYLRVVFLMYGSGAAATVALSPSPGSGVPEIAAAEAGVSVAGSIARGAAEGGGDGGVAVAAVATAGAVATLEATESERAAQLTAEATAAETAAMAAEDAAAERIEVPPGAEIGLGLCVVFTVVFGIWPGPLFAFVHAATLLF